MSTKYLPAKIPGFSLIEMAVVLIIMGLIGGLTLPALKIMVDWQKARTTSQHQEKILYALASYANENKFLPFAADPSISNGLQDEASHRRRGIVPYANLGLPESVAKDGYHRWFTYVVDEHYTIPPPSDIHGSASPQRVFTAQPVINRLCNVHKHINPLRIRGLDKTIAVALISHGPEGRGAYPNPQNPAPQGADELQNSTSDREIIDRPISHDPSHPFSHTVVWVTSKNLLSIYGHAPCPPVQQTSPNLY